MKQIDNFINNNLIDYQSHHSKASLMMIKQCTVIIGTMWYLFLNEDLILLKSISCLRLNTKYCIIISRFMWSQKNEYILFQLDTDQNYFEYILTQSTSPQGSNMFILKQNCTHVKADITYLELLLKMDYEKKRISRSHQKDGLFRQYGKMIPQNTAVDKQLLYAQGLHLKQYVNAYYQQNSKLRTKIAYLQKEILKGNRNTVSGSHVNSSALKVLLSRAKQQNAKLKTENHSLQRNLKLTNNQQLKIQNQTLQQQLQRLRNIIQQQSQIVSNTVTLRKRNDKLEKDNKQQFQVIKSLKIDISILKDKNRKLNDQNNQIHYLMKQNTKKMQRDNQILRRRLNDQMEKLQTLAYQYQKVQKIQKRNNQSRARMRSIQQSPKRQRQSQTAKEIRKKNNTFQPQRNQSNYNKEALKQKDQINQNIINDISNQPIHNSQNNITTRQKQQYPITVKKDDFKKQLQKNQQSKQQSYKFEQQSSIKQKYNNQQSKSINSHQSQSIQNYHKQIKHQNQSPSKIMSDQYQDQFQHDPRSDDNSYQAYDQFQEYQSQLKLQSSSKQPQKSQKNIQSISKQSTKKKKTINKNQQLTNLGQLIAFRMLTTGYNTQTVIAALKQQKVTQISVEQIYNMLSNQPFYTSQQEIQLILYNILGTTEQTQQQPDIPFKTFAKKLKKIIPNMQLPDTSMLQKLQNDIIKFITKKGKKLVKKHGTIMSKDQCKEVFTKYGLSQSATIILIGRIAILSNNLLQLMVEQFITKFIQEV